MLVCQMTAKTQIELQKGIYLMPRLKIQSDCKHENNDENAKNNMIKSQYLKVTGVLWQLWAKSAINWKELTRTPKRRINYFYLVRMADRVNTVQPKKYAAAFVLSFYELKSVFLCRLRYFQSGISSCCTEVVALSYLRKWQALINNNKRFEKQTERTLKCTSATTSPCKLKVDK